MLSQVCEKLTFLNTLNLSYCGVPEAQWTTLLKSLPECLRLQSLDLTATHLGYQRQEPCVEVTESARARSYFVS